MLLNNKELIDKFLNHVLHEKRYSQHTVDAYENDLTSFFNFSESFSGFTEIPKIEVKIIRKWLASLKEVDTDSRSINRKISTLRSFFKYYYSISILKQNPMRTISNLKVSKRIVQALPEVDIETLFSCVDFPSTWDGRTHELLLHILYNTGVRCEELITLTVSNIDFDRMNIKVLGKGNRERIIPVNKELIRLITVYIAGKGLEFLNCETNYLLVTKKGLKLYSKYVYNVVNMYLSAVTTIDHKSPHIMRHTFATHLMKNGAALAAVKDLLGHDSLASTQIYVNNNINNLMKIHARAHPKS